MDRDRSNVIKIKVKSKKFTWGEFKQLFESNGIKDDFKIWYIDIDLDQTDKIYLFPDPDGIQCTNFPNQ